jgi:hypothetical protein
MDQTTEQPQEQRALAREVYLYLCQNDSEMCLDAWGTTELLYETIASLGRDPKALVRDNLLSIGSPEITVDASLLHVEQRLSFIFKVGLASVEVCVPHVMAFDLDEPNRLDCEAWRTLCALTNNRE